jgi:hypothetical protein
VRLNERLQDLDERVLGKRPPVRCDAPRPWLFRYPILAFIPVALIIVSDQLHGLLGDVGHDVGFGLAVGYGIALYVWVRRRASSDQPALGTSSPPRAAD